jgi:hypothetical protein
LKFRPSGKRRSPAKGGASAILDSSFNNNSYVCEEINIPVINGIENLLRFWCWVFSFDVVVYPCDKVVLEDTFDQLV